jgi:energy-coupling factor transporter ATP-binding protein EcfA2
LPANRHLLAFEDVTLDLGSRVLGPWRFEIVGPERVAVIGPNGAGKTTLLRVAMGWTAPSKGTVRRAGGKTGLRFSVYSIGVSYKGSFARAFSGTQAYKVNAHKSSKARFLVIDSEGAVGITPVLETSDKYGFDQADEGPGNFCQDIGPVTLEQLDEVIISDKKRLSEFLGLPVSEYQVDYQQRPAGP